MVALDRHADLSATVPTSLPLALARLHRSVPVGAVTTVEGPSEPRDGPAVADLAEGAGFSVVDATGDRVRLRRVRTLADTVGPAMSLLVVGLNPSLYAADAGVGFARPGNRFWPAMVEAGLVDAERDAFAALVDRGVGMTDLVKRATRRAAELDRGEYAHGLARVQRLVTWLRPGVVVVVGLAGWRSAVDRRATPGLQDVRLGGRPVYVMGSTSGLNAHQQLPDAVGHLRAAASVASRDPVR